jgi:predicted PurR-regulated permease PerM
MKDVRIHFDKNNLFEVALIAGLIYALWTISDFLLVLGVALIISAFIEDFVQFTKKRIPRIVAVLIFYIIGITAFSVILIFLIPVFSTELGLLSETYPEIQSFIGTGTDLIGLGSSETSLVGSEFSDWSGDQASYENLFNQILSVFGGIVNFLIIGVVSFYLSTQEKGIDSMLRIFTPLKYEEMVVSLWHRVQHKIGSWFRGQLLMALILTGCTYLGLLALGVPYSFLLALLAGLFGLVPYGIFLALIPAVVMSLLRGGWVLGVGVVVFYIILQQVLDLIIQPLIVKKFTGIPSLVVILSVFIGAKLFGLYGLLLAVPIALFGMELIAESEKNKSALRAPLIEHEDITVKVKE